LEPELRVKDLQDNDVLKKVFKREIPPTKVKVLGLLWDYVRDVMGLDFTLVERASRPITKRKMLVTLHSLYDVLGVLIPFFITGKLQVQDCWREGLTWKDNVTIEKENLWFEWQDQIDQLNLIEIDRVIIPGQHPENYDRQLHIFGDASQDVYSALAYMRNTNHTGIQL
jgi:hypothetical protein